jgi:hypothetical protein
MMYNDWDLRSIKCFWSTETLNWYYNMIQHMLWKALISISYLMHMLMLNAVKHLNFWCFKIINFDTDISNSNMLSQNCKTYFHIARRICKSCYNGVP